MKKLLFAVTIAVCTFWAACAPSANKNTDAEKSKNDSIAAVHHTDSLMAAQMQQHRQDSINALKAIPTDTSRVEGDKK